MSSASDFIREMEARYGSQLTGMRRFHNALLSGGKTPTRALAPLPKLHTPTGQRGTHSPQRRSRTGQRRSRTGQSVAVARVPGPP